MRGMRRARAALLALVATTTAGFTTATAATVAAPAGAVDQPTYELISRTPTGQPGNGHTYSTAITADGRSVAFASDASDIVAGDTNATRDLFIRDRVTGAVERVSVAAGGGQATAPPNEWSGGPLGPWAMSDDGSTFVFGSAAENLVPGDTNGYADLFVRDRTAGTTTRVNLTTTGAQSSGSGQRPVAISGDGRVVYFVTYERLAPTDTDWTGDVYRRDLQTGQLTHVTEGLPEGNAMQAVKTTTDGRWVAFDSEYRVYRRDMAGTGLAEEVAPTVDGLVPNNFSAVKGISDDGGVVAFTSSATNFAAGDTSWRDTFVVVPGQAVQRLSAATNGSNGSHDAIVARDGRTIVYSVMNLGAIVFDRTDGTRRTIELSGGSDSLSASRSLDVLAYASTYPILPSDTTSMYDAYVADLRPVDTVPPVVTCPPVDTTWTRFDNGAECTAGDAGSGLADPADAAFTLLTSVPEGTADADASTDERSICDLAGNCTPAVLHGYRVDKAPPTGRVTAPDPVNSTFVQGATVPYEFTCDDEGSGVASCEGSIPSGGYLPTDSPSFQYESITATDAAGNTAVTEVDYIVDEFLAMGTVRLDNGDLAPTSTRMQLVPSAGGPVVAERNIVGNGFYGFRATDAPAGTYRVRAVLADGSSITSEPVELGVRYRSVNLTGTPLADSAAPVVSCAPPAPGAPREDNVTVACTATDAGAGLADPSQASFTLSTSVAGGAESGSASTGTAEVCDTVGNCATAGPFGPYVVDRQAPRLNIDGPPDGGTIVAGRLWRAYYACTDLTLVSCTGTTPSGQLPPGALGYNTFTVTGTDAVGRQTSRSATYRVVAPGIRGYATSVANGQPLVAATVQVFVGATPTGSPVATATTDGAGYYFLDATNLASGNLYTVRITKPGFAATNVSLRWYFEDPNPMFVAVKPDTDPPVVVCQPPSSANWRSGDVAVSCTAYDPDGDLASTSPSSFTLSTGVPSNVETTTAMTGTRQICDTSAHCVTAGPFGPYKVDKKLPTSTCPAAPTDWLKANVGITCTLADTGSGLSGAPTQVVGTTLTAGLASANVSTNTVSRCDVAGNCVPVVRSGFKIDLAIPTISCTTTNTSWAPQNVQVPCTTADVGSGLTSTAPTSLATNVAFGTETANAPTISGPPICDVAGNCRAPGAVTTNAKVDRKAPTFSCPPSPAWRNTNYTGTCTQVEGGSGLPNSIVTTRAGFFGAPGETVQIPNPQTMPFATTVGVGESEANAIATDQGFGFASFPFTYAYNPPDVWCDMVMNCAPGAVGGFRIDRQAPAAVCSPAASDPAWRGTNATVTCALSDTGSGAAQPTVTTSTTVAVGAETGATSTPGVSACDVLGNCATVGATSGWRIDRKGPAISLAGLPSERVRGTVVPAPTPCTDAGSGLASCGLEGGASTIDTSTLGARSVVFQGTDQVGNASAATYAYTVLPQLRGTVGTTAGPVANQVVQVTGPAPATTTISPRTAADGTWSAEGLAAGTYTVRIVRTGFTTVTRTITVSATTPTAVPVALDVEARMTGKVTTAGGTPLIDTKVSLFLGDADTPITTITTGVAGTWLLTGLPAGTYKVRGIANGHLVGWYGGARTQAAAATIVVGPGQTGTANIEMEPTAAITGTVTDSITGNPVAGANVWLYPVGPGPQITKAVTAANGTYLLAGLASGTYNVLVEQEGVYTPQWGGGANNRGDAVPVTITGTTRRDVSLVRIATIAGLLTGPDGRGLSNISVVVDPVGPGTIRVVYTRPDGTWSVAGLAEGPHTVQYIGGAYVPEYHTDAPTAAAAARVVAVGGSTISITDDLAPATTLKGRVVDAATGLPLAGVTVSAYPEGATVRTGTATTGADGRYTITPIAPGRHSVSFLRTGTIHGVANLATHLSTWGGGAALRGDGVVVTTRTTSAVELDEQLTPGAVITGSAVDAVTGDPLTGAIVRAFVGTATAPATNALVAADGTFVLAGLPAGSIDISVTKAGYATTWGGSSPNRPGSTPVVVTAGSDTAIDPIAVAPSP